MSQHNKPIEESSKTWAHDVIELYTQGCSDAEVAAALRVPLRKYYKHIQDNSAFAQLVEYGRTLSQAYWEGLARKNITNKQFNSPLFCFYMKNKFAWTDKTETTTVGASPDPSLDELRDKISKEVAEYIERYTPELTDAQRVLKVVSDTA